MKKSTIWNIRAFLWVLKYAICTIHMPILYYVALLTLFCFSCLWYICVQCYKPFLFCFIFLAHCNQQNYIPNKNNFKSTLTIPMYIYTCELCICIPIVTNINQALLSSLYSLTSKSNLHGGDMYPVGTYVFEKQIYSSLDITLSVPPSKTI